MRSGADIQTMQRQLQGWARERYGPGSAVANVAPMPGNSGVSFGFDVSTTGQTEPLVIRLSPPGVERRGNTDVLRQVPLLQSLRAEGVPVAEVVWWSDDEHWFGTDALIQRRLDAQPLHMWTDSLSHPAPPHDRERLLLNAVQVLVQIHRAPILDKLANWESGRSLNEEIWFWDTILHKSTDPSWIALGERHRDELLECVPGEPERKLFHGDFQTNNVLFDPAGAVVAVVDWEIAGLGAQLMDLGWFALFNDASCWDPVYAEEMRVSTDPRVLLHEYERLSGSKVADFEWFRSLACFRFGAIAAFNVRLHRTGRHIDANWDRIAPSVPYLFTSGRHLLK